MKRIAALALLILASFPAHGATLLRLHEGAYDSDAQAYFNTLVANGCVTPSIAFKQIISNFIVSERAIGAWGTQDFRFVPTTNDSCTASINLEQSNLYKATITNTCLFSTANGMIGNGVDCALTPGVTDTNMTRYSQNSAHVLVCVNAGGSSNVGQNGATLRTSISTIPNKVTRLTGSVNITDTGGGGSGCHFADRSSSSAINTGLNGAIQSNAAASTSAPVASEAITLCQNNALFCTSSIHSLYFEAGAPISNEAAHYTNVRTMLLALGATGI